MFRENFESSFTWMEGFLRNVRRFHDKTALIDPILQKEWSYSELNEEANRLANALQNDGVGYGDLLLYQLVNSPEFVFSYLAPQKIGAISAPLNYALSATETAHILNTFRPKVYMVGEEFVELAKSALELSEYKPTRVIVVPKQTGAEQLPEAVTTYADYVGGMSAEEPKRERPAHIYDEVLRLFSSGTTGHPKAVPINNACEVLSAHDVMIHFPLNERDITMNMTPWFHRGGVHSGGLTPTLYAGGTVVILRQFHPVTCLRLTEQYGITFLVGVPSVLALLSRAQTRQKADLSSLKGIVTMGSPLDKAACIHFQETLTPNIYNGYGTTETFWNTFLRPYDLPEMAGSAGRACVDDDVRVVKAYEDHRAEPDELVATDNNEVGEIIIRSVKSTCTYVGDEEQSKRRFYKGYMYTGDLGRWDSNQFVTIVSRKDDMIISSGENIYPTPIEEAICEHPKVLECAVTAVPDPLRGEAVTAYVVADDGLTVSELQQWCLEHTAISVHGRPRYYCFVDALPRTATGKIQHIFLRAHAAEDLKNGKLKKE